jgi:S-(hydroxymethyl)glutathione dehydrogenase/alcohol dehydrogenase
MTHLVNPKETDGDVPHLVNMTKRGVDQIGGADYTFDCTGNIWAMRQALEARTAAGQVGHRRCRRRGRFPTRPFRWSPTNRWHRLAARAAASRRRRRLVHGRQDQIDPMITHTPKPGRSAD